MKSFIFLAHTLFIAHKIFSKKGLRKFFFSVFFSSMATIAAPLDQVDLNKKIYIQKTYMAPQFQTVWGDPWSSTYTVLVFTSLSCDICRDFHRKIGPRLKQTVLQKRGVAVILRDYPADGPSMNTSSSFWKYGQSDGNILVEKNFQFDNPWKKNPKDIDHLTKNYLLSVRQKAQASDNLSPLSHVPFYDIKGLQQIIFERRNQDKSALNIQVVPTVFVIHKKGTDTRTWTLKQLENPTDEAELNQALDGMLVPAP